MYLIKHAGKEVPKATWEKIVATGYSAFGVAFINGKTKMFDIIHKNQAPTVDALVTVGNKFKDTKVFFSFQQQAKTIDDVMPYTILKEDKTTLMLVFLDGDFSVFKEDTSAHPPEFFFAYEYLRPRLQKELKEGNLDKVLELIGGNVSFQKDMIRGITSASILPVANNGKTVHIIRNKPMVTEEWGNISSEPWKTAEPAKIPDVATPVEEPETEEEQSLEDLLGGTASEELVQKALETTETITTDPPVLDDVREKPDIGADEETYESLEAPPENLTSNNKLRTWYNRMAGFIPNDFRERPKVPVLRKRKKGTTAAAPAPTKSQQTGRIVKDFKEIAQKKEEVGPREVLPIIDGKSLALITEKLLTKPKIIKTVDVSSQEVPHPSTAAGWDTKTPTFTEQIGLKGGLEAMASWGFEDLVDIATIDPRASARLNMDLLAHYFSTKNKGSKTTETKRTEPVDITTEAEEQSLEELLAS